MSNEISVCKTSTQAKKQKQKADSKEQNNGNPKIACFAGSFQKGR